MSNTPNLPDRVRDHEAPHIRHVDVQTLDALLRIEELLQKLLATAETVQADANVATNGEGSPPAPKAPEKPAPQAANKKRNGRFL